MSMLSGTVEHFAERRASTRRQALERIAEIIHEEALDPEQASEALASTAAGYLGDDCWYRSEALSVLAEAGADLERARRIRALRAGARRIRFGDAEL